MPLAGTVAVGLRVGVAAGERRAEFLKQKPRILYAVPEEVIDHLAGNVEVHLLVGTPQEVGNDHPFAAGFPRKALTRRLPFT